VDLPHRGRRQRRADVRRASLVALVLGLRPVVHSPTPPVTVHTAAPELGVERVERLAIEHAQRQRAEHRAHMDVGAADVRLPRGLLELDHREVPIKQLVDRRLRPRVALLVDLVEQARPDLLGLRCRPEPGGTTSVRSWLFLMSGSTPVHAAPGTPHWAADPVTGPTKATLDPAPADRSRHRVRSQHSRSCVFPEAGRVGLEPTSDGL
jgi:hypothetical protein